MPPKKTTAAPVAPVAPAKPAPRAKVTPLAPRASVPAAGRRTVNASAAEALTARTIAAAKGKKITSWSFSRYNDYRSCPRKAFFKHVCKLKEPGSAAMDRGTAIHKMAEDWIKGVSKKMPPELALFKDDLNKLKAAYKKRTLPITVEDNWAFTADWTQTQWNDWIGCWVRIKIDAAHYADADTVVVTDFKTGKFRDDKNDEYVEQLEIYILSALLMYPGAKVRARLLYLDTGDVFELDRYYTATDIEPLKKLWAKRTKPMLSDTTFAPKPGNGCTWCHFSKGKSGPCKF